MHEKKTPIPTRRIYGILQAGRIDWWYRKTSPLRANSLMLEIIQQASKASYPNVEPTHTVLQPLLLSVAKSTGFHHPILSSKSILKIVLRNLQFSQIAPPPQRAQGELALLRLFIQHSFRSFPTFTYKI
jgi:hypothetical protein